MLITLTTDFGYKDPYAGIMKGVILGINPAASIVDVTHGVAPHNVKEAALVIEEAHRHFPPLTVHVVVVDPGVGSERRPIAVWADRQFFVGPDNGVFTEVYKSAETLHVLRITASQYFLKGPGGGTFHGRDVFAPVSAWLSRGINFFRFGEPVEDYVRLDLPSPRAAEGRVEGEVVLVDGFGNAITNIRASDVEALRARALRVLVKGLELEVVGFYSEGRDGRPRALVNSSGLVEVFVYMADASKALGVGVGEKVSVEAG